MRIVQPNIGQEDKWRPGLRRGSRAPARDAVRPADRRAAPPAVAGSRGHRSAPGCADRRAPGAGAIPADERRLAARSRRSAADRRDRVCVARRTPCRRRREQRVRARARRQVVGRYDKAHLVPYGEYLPMRPLLSAIGLSRLAPGDVDFTSGPGPRTDRPWRPLGQGRLPALLRDHLLGPCGRREEPARHSSSTLERCLVRQVGTAAASRPGAAARGRGRHARPPRDADRHQRRHRRPRQCREVAAVAHRRA